MTGDQDTTTRFVRAWLEEGATVLPDHLLDRVLDDLPTTPQRRRPWSARRIPTMNLSLKLVFLTGALVLATSLGLAGLLGPRADTPVPLAAPTTEPSPSPSPAAEPSPEASPMSFFGEWRTPLPPDTYVQDRYFPARLTFTVPEGWHKVGADEGSVLLGKARDPASRDVDWAGLAAIGFWIVEDVYRDPCRRDLGTEDPGPTVEDLTEALVNQPDARASEPVEATFAGHAGTYFETQPVDFSECHWGQWAMWRSPGEHDAISFGAHSDRLGRTWIIDVEGTRVLVGADWRLEASDEDRAELEAVIDSVRIEPLPDDTGS
jgi:hypothetical protein